ncbi:MAG TPA: hypothetical protein VMF30_03335 [Pirellulales bacterium]|nr:hypothetical protein [Pirellulales bacterium]
MPTKLYSRIALWLGLVCLLTAAGCAAAGPYQYGRFHSDLAKTPSAEETGPTVEFGKPVKVLDCLASAVSFPEKIMGFNHRIGNHAVSLDTVAKLRAYLGANDMADVAVYVNCYDPLAQWRRLQENKRVGAGWRYTLGTLTVVSYTLLPSRVLGGDYYNPYTNTLNIDSDVPAIAILEGAMAKIVHARKFPGTYATLAELPGFSLARRSMALGDVLGYVRERHDWETERQAYHVLYSQIGAETAITASVVSPAWWAAPVFGAGGAAVGQVTGRLLAARRAAEIEAESADDASLALDERPPPEDPETRPSEGVAVATLTEPPE